MAHPIHLIKRYHQNIENGKYSRIRENLREDLVADPMPDLQLVDRVASLTASRARVIDKLNLIREIVASGVHAERGETLADDDYLLILAGWAAEMRGRFDGR